MTSLGAETGLVLNNYKEPLKKVSKPYFGYIGAILITKDGEKMQCHICGELFSNVAQHSWRAHKLKAKQYKLKFNLMSNSSLVSENERDRMKITSMRWWLKMTPEERLKAKKKFKLTSRLAKQGRKKGSKNRLESNNKKGSCPDQIADQIQKCAKSIGTSPSQDDFLRWSGSMRFVGLARYRFGSWTKAVKYAGITPKGKLKRKGTSNPGMNTRRYTDDELLELLLIFHQETGKIPSYTDCRRGLLPSGDSYRKRFGSFKTARKKAGITEQVGPIDRFKSPFGNGLMKTGYKSSKIAA